MIPAGPFTFGSDADFLRFSRKGAAHECRNDAAGIRPAGAATERYRDGQCGRRRLIVWVDRAAQAEAEVERSEGEGEAQGRPVVVLGVRDAVIWGAGGVQYLIGSVRGPEGLCVRICARRRRLKDGTGGVLVVFEDG